jgi:DNA-directed RNA polymerase specialized sigma24 family protein
MRRHPIAQAGLDEDALSDLVARSRGGDEAAWGKLWLALAPRIENVARRWRVTGRLSRCPDGRRDIVVRVMGELREDGFRRLAELGERLACRDGSSRGWLWKVARNAAVSHVRQHPEYLAPVEGGPGRWADHVPISEAPEDEHPPMSRQIECRLILARSREMLDPAQRDALDGWLCDDAGAAPRLVRSAVRRLRSRFGRTARRAGSKKIDRYA